MGDYDSDRDPGPSCSWLCSQAACAHRVMQLCICRRQPTHAEATHVKEAGPCQSIRQREKLVATSQSTTECGDTAWRLLLHCPGAKGDNSAVGHQVYKSSKLLRHIAAGTLAVENPGSTSSSIHAHVCCRTIGWCATLPVAVGGSFTVGPDTGGVAVCRGAPKPLCFCQRGGHQSRQQQQQKHNSSNSSSSSTSSGSSSTTDVMQSWGSWIGVRWQLGWC